MKHTRIFLMAALIAVGLASCTKDEAKVSFTATMEGYGTKTELSSNGHSLLWQAGDQITVNGNIYQTDEGGHTSAEFSYAGSGSEPSLSAPYTATYPTDYWNTTGTLLTLPFTQNYMEDGMEKFPMCCKSYRTNLGFKNPCGVVRIHPTKNGKNITQITIETERYITGNFRVAFDDDYIPRMTYSANGSQIVNLICPAGRSISNGEDFYIYLPPATYGLFKITLYADDQTYCTKTANTDIVVERSRVTDITLPSEGLDFSGMDAPTLSIVGGNNQRGWENQALRHPIYVSISSVLAYNPGWVVKYTVTSGGGSVSPIMAVPDNNFRAQTMWTLGVAGTQTVTAVMVNLTTQEEISNTVTFHATADALSDFDALSGVFSISPTKQVRFACGNLQNINGEWQFAEHQYDYLGTYSATAWDLFGWSHGRREYLDGDYAPGFYYDYGMNISSDPWSLYIIDGFADWGTQIGDGHTWYTLSIDAWIYVLYTRTDAVSKKGRAMVNGVHGLILLPDVWTLPAGLTFNSGGEDFSPWTLNQYNAAEWELMETAGAVFLPAAGYRGGTGVSAVGTYGFYWSSSSFSIGEPNCMYFHNNGDDTFELICDVPSGLDEGYSVRLVQEYHNN